MPGLMPGAASFDTLAVFRHGEGFCMMSGQGSDGDVYAKTEKGRDEIATRRYRLAARLRALLLMIDGQRSLAVLDVNFGAAGETAGNVATLLDGGYIAFVRVDAPSLRLVQPHANTRPEPGPAPVTPSPTPPAKPAAPATMHDIYSARRR